MTVDKKFIAPALPIPPLEYEQRYGTDLIRILRLYFTQLDTFLSQVAIPIFNGTGPTISLPHIAASDSTDQIATGNNTPTVVAWDTLDSGYQWTLNPPGSATANVAGIYKITYSLQFINTDNSIHYATVWLKVNNNDVPNSSTIFHVPARKSASVGEEGFLAAYSEVTFAIEAGDEIELYWATDQAGNPTTPTNGVYMFHDAAWTTPTNPYARPAVPSAIGSITFVSAIPPA